MSESLIATANIKPSTSNLQQTFGETLLAQVRRSRLGFRIGNIRSSRQRTGAISRGPRACGGETIDVTALLPKTNEAKLAAEKKIEIESTVSQSPTLLIYISKTQKTKGTFVVVGEKNNEAFLVQEKQVELPGRGGVVSVTVDLPKGEDENISSGVEEPLYHWFFTIDCNPNDPDTSGDLVVDGWVKLMPKDDSLTQDLAQAQERDRPAVYAQHENWTETVSTLADLRQRYPNEQQLKDDWQSLLKSVGLDRLANAEIIGALKEMEN
ncbi:DUF928 domain-containing protein [Limnofasciculus baicalensis]|uniref:DUF928 domain-containing protein n=1 Tax=Limnofasciculus baicalensis BBK-W-15 TaxID=2699891 RepID=A0AAE3GWZ6_9CYAN|nr:DUF928 domain-containing protein [Limnofasciculus baicalensis]MCP2731607.1 DUF928 domain-containing protein [Limnofasciculus baicalensis BBK-W-15]